MIRHQPSVSQTSFGPIPPFATVAIKLCAITYRVFALLENIKNKQAEMI